MTASIDDSEQTYQQAYKAYVQRNYEEAATLIDRAVQHQPDDPNTHLLRGHVYFVLQKYDVAKEEYLYVLELTDQQEIIDFAHNGLENISQYQQQLNEGVDVDNYEENNSSSSDFLHDPIDVDNHEENNSSSSDFLHDPIDVDNYEENNLSSSDFLDEKNLENLDDLGEINSQTLYFTSFSEQEAVEEIELPPHNPFNLSTKNASLDSTSNPSLTAENNPFILNNRSAFSSEQDITSDAQQSELSPFWQPNVDSTSIEALTLEDSKLPTKRDNEQENVAPHNISAPFTRTPINKKREDQANIDTDTLRVHNNFEDENLVLSAGSNNLDSTTSSLGTRSPEKLSNSSAMTSKLNNDLNRAEKQNGSSTGIHQNNFDDEDGFDFEAFESAFASETFTNKPDASALRTSENITHSKNIEFLDDFDEFDDLGNIPGFDFTGESSSGLLSTNGRLSPIAESATKVSSNDASSREAELFSITASGEQVPVFTQPDITKVEPQVTVEQGFLAPLENAPLQTKQWFIAGTVGISCALVVAVVSFASANFSPSQQRSAVRNTGWVMTLAAGIAGFATASVMGNLTMRQIRRTTKDLQAQFDAVRQGNLNVQATVYSEDELGQLATDFNEMARVIFTTTNEATRKAQEQEEAKENLQRQVIRLLDDVEGAARGDLTVQAEVTADVLGAVADAFNLTIQNLRDIVQQVKVAAKEVTKGATNSETFARALSSDALRQAEELAVTLNSVQVMTDSIQRVAEAAREAEAVARNASEIALKGGDAVENTVAGILEIRETVAETTRKVKRLAESSQEISKIVALISQIASRTNLLALNASIEAARAGEAGRGFAIVADEVRQLADRSAKSLKEIEEIVRQIQSETSSVMTAMEEGTQQVIKGTKLAEEAKRSLENIIQVANRIDILVGSITTDTVEQTETSRAVAQVMQSVELTAQETSQEAQRVSGALQHLVGVSRDLIASVERFRVETAESR